MKKKFYGVLCAAACAVMLSSCASIQSEVGPGYVFTGVTQGQIATSNEMGTKVGTARAVNVLGIVAAGDASINTAAQNAGITKISHVDTRKVGVLGIFGKYTTFVYGE